MTKKLIILGANGNALDMMDVVDAIAKSSGAARWEAIGFLDDGRAAGELFAGLPVLGTLADGERLLRETERCFLINAIGSDRSFRRRGAFAEKTGVPAEKFAVLVHPAAEVSSRARIGSGVCINYGVSVAGNVRLEDHVMLGPRSVVGHDSEIGANSVLAAGALVAGGVAVGRSCYLGSGSMVRQQIRIGDGALVGMGAVVVRDVDSGQTVAGNPARVLLKRPWPAVAAGSAGAENTERVR